MRNGKAMKNLGVPEVYLADVDQGLILMENLKTRGFTMLNRVDGEGMFQMFYLF